ncbi:Putative peptidyl-tRNA hydrolase PTRHD1 [Coccomyxa sp. Obi]|nr:Putative peptidyl-tRNA hydrolase PTRHD1 [Coccomyxa sp. Obi]
MSAPSLTVASNAQSGNPSVSDGPSVSGQDQDVLVQYIVLRSDLWKSLGWPLGSIIAQACHAATAALWLSRDQPHSQAYCSDSNLDHMHKVVLEVKGDVQLTNLAEKLQEAGIPHKLWVEQPENFVTCLATAPGPKSLIQQHFKKLKLCKGT